MRKARHNSRSAAPRARAASASAENATAVADAAESARARHLIVVTFWMLLYQGYAMAVNGIAAPWIAKSFGLGEDGIARLFAWVSLSSIGALVLARAADRIGRRRVLLGAMAATPLVSLAAAAANHVVVFTALEIVYYALIAATVSGSVVMLAEGLPIHLRARGQGYAGLAQGLGGGICVILTPLLVEHGYSWRWLLVGGGLGLAMLPWIFHALPESARWQKAAAHGSTARTRFYDVFGADHLERAAPMLVCALLSMTASAAVTSWGYYHAVQVVGLSASAASTMMIVGGAMSFVGLSGGAWGAERFGRVPTVAVAGLLTAAGGLFFYWGPPARFPHPGMWLAAGFCWFMAAVNAWTIGGNAAATELFPTAMRGTMIGWFAIAQAIASVGAQATIALLAKPLGGLSVVVGYLGLLTIPSALLFVRFIDETRGLSLDAAAREDIGELP